VDLESATRSPLSNSCIAAELHQQLRDPWGNLWWVYRHSGQSWAGDEEGADWTSDAAATGAEGWDQSSPGLTYIHDTLLAAMRQLQDPREATP
jgi:hypothetical protein